MGLLPPFRLHKWKFPQLLIQTAPVLDFAFGYLLAVHFIWHGIFLFRSPPVKPFSKRNSNKFVMHKMLYGTGRYT